MARCQTAMPRRHSLPPTAALRPARRSTSATWAAALRGARPAVALVQQSGVTPGNKPGNMLAAAAQEVQHATAPIFEVSSGTGPEKDIGASLGNWL